jgi:hypothetical protein
MDNGNYVSRRPAVEIGQRTYKAKTNDCIDLKC